MTRSHIIYKLKFSTDIESFQHVAENVDLSKSALRVFMFMCCRLESEHVRKIDIKQMANSLDLTKGKVEEAINELEKYNIIQQGMDDHIKNGYRMTYTEDEYNY